MKKLSRYLSSLALLALFLTGCTTTINGIKSGTDFDESKVGEIKKGVTTELDLVRLYGDPNKKDIVSSNQVMWHYTYMVEDHQFHTQLFSPDTETTSGFKKNLDVMIQDGVVINFTYLKSPATLQKSTSSLPW